MNAIQTFDFETKPVRTLVRDDEPWFAGKDVCEVLEISDHKQALKRLDEDERGGYTVPTPGGPQELTVISEPGLFRLVFTSRTAKAQVFKRWVCHEVLPALRRTGRYALPGRDDDGEEEEAALRPGNPAFGEALSAIREARLVFGPAAARRLWGLFDLPALATPAALAPDHGDSWAVDAFLAERCLLGANLTVSWRALFAAYHAFMQEQDAPAAGLTAFGIALARRGIRKRRTGPRQRGRLTEYTVLGVTLK